jgi:predicted permease
MSGVMADLRYSIRMLIKRPGTSVLAMLALALGIGLTTTMFSIVNGAILRGLPFDESHRILHVARQNLPQGQQNMNVSPHDFADYRARQRVFSEIAAFHNVGVTVSGSGAAADRYRGVRITPNTFTLLRVAPIHGREFSDADAAPGAPAVAIISHQIWETRFRGDRAAIGQVMRINQIPVEVVGVMPPGFRFPVTHDVWMPLALELPVTRGEGVQMEVIGRLAAGVSAADASAGMAAIAAQLAAEHAENQHVTTLVRPYVREFIGNEPITVLFSMLGCVIGVLLIACANVTNLQLARAMERAREVAIRSAMGAGRWRVVRQMLLEGLLLSAAGAALGVGIAEVGTTLFDRAIADTNPPFWIDVRLDGTVLLFTIFITAAAALLSSVVPALRVTRGRASDVLKDESRSTTSLRAGLLTKTLVGGAVMLACALLLVSGLMVKSVVRVRGVSYAFATGDVTLARLNLDDTRYPTTADVERLADRLGTRLAGMPDTRRVTISTGEPGTGAENYLTLEGQSFAPDDPRQPTVRRLAVTPAYFDVLRVAPASGRLFTADDRAGTQPVVVVSADFAATYFPGRDPLGQRIRLSRVATWPWWTIVGVVPTLVSSSDPSQVRPTAYIPLAQAQSPERGLTLLAAGHSGPVPAASLRQAFMDVDADLPLSNVESLASFFGRRNWPVRVFGTLFLCFGAAALVMAAAGLYGVLSFSVRRRTSEIGVRMALGANRARVLRLILKQALWIVGIGLTLGLGIGILIGPLMGPLLNNVDPRDPQVFAITLASLVGVAFASTIVPALRAARLDPIKALRHE